MLAILFDVEQSVKSTLTPSLRTFIALSFVQDLPPVSVHT